MIETRMVLMATQHAATASSNIPHHTVSLSNTDGCVSQTVSSFGNASPPDVLVVDDDDYVRKACREIVARSGLAVKEAADLTEARVLLQCQKFDLLLLDLKLPDGNGLDLLRQVKALYPDADVVVMTAFATISSAVRAMQIGASDYLTKPFGREELTKVLERAHQRFLLDQERQYLREAEQAQKRTDGLIGGSEEMQRLYRILAKVTYSTHPVLILGEDGTEKELVGRSIHLNGPDAAKPFVVVDCRSQAPELLEKELFGYSKDDSIKGDSNCGGLLAMAKGGTVYLDEIGELPAALQTKLLRAMQHKEVRPVGSRQAQPLSVRVLAATSLNLPELVARGRFRKDLYARLNVVNLRIPPLRYRERDVIQLATYFLEQNKKETGITHVLSDDALRVITEYDWPGNVWELEQAVEGACTLAATTVLQTGDLPAKLQDFWSQRRRNTHPESVGNDTTPEAATSDREPQVGKIVSMAELEKQAIRETILHVGGNKLKAAELLGIGKTTLYRKLKEYEIAPN